MGNRSKEKRLGKRELPKDMPNSTNNMPNDVKPRSGVQDNSSEKITTGELRGQYDRAAKKLRRLEDARDKF